MDRAGIHALLKELNARNIADQGEWVMSACVLAPWTHQSGGDRHRSFGISVKDRDRSIFHCFTCGKKGTLKYLVELLAAHSGEDFEDLIDGLTRGEELGPPASGWSEREVKETDRLSAPISPDWMMVYQDPFRHSPAAKYLRSRGISEETCNRLQLRYDMDEQRILFPVFDTTGDLHGFTGRAIKADIEPRVKDYQGLKKRLLLLGGQFLAEWRKRVVVCEGPFDYAKLQEAGIGGAVSTMFAGLTEHQARILTTYNRPVVLFYDNDDAGHRAADQAYEALHRHLPVMRVEYTDHRKDPGEFSSASLRLMVERADL